MVHPSTFGRQLPCFAPAPTLRIFPGLLPTNSRLPLLSGFPPLASPLPSFSCSHYYFVFPQLPCPSDLVFPLFPQCSDDCGSELLGNSGLETRICYFTLAHFSHLCPFNFPLKWPKWVVKSALRLRQIVFFVIPELPNAHGTAGDPGELSAPAWLIGWEWLLVVVTLHASYWLQADTERSAKLLANFGSRTFITFWEFLLR